MTDQQPHTDQHARHGHGHDHDHDHDHDHGSAHAQERPDHDHGRHAQAHGPHGSHGHAHAHAHAHAPASFDRAFAIGILLNLGFVTIEAFYGWRINSLALLADAGHNLSDVAGLVLAWVATLAARRQPDARHTYGWQRASLLAALANAVLLLVAMGSLGWEAVQRLGTPQPPAAGWTMVVVAAIGIVVNTATALLFLRGSHGDINLRGAFLHMAGDALVSLGVVVAGLLFLWKGWAWLDPVLSLVIVLVIVAGSWGLLKQSVHLLFDGVPDGVDLAAVRAALAGVPGVAGVHDLHVWAMGSTRNALTAHLALASASTDAAAVLQAAQQALQQRFDIRHATLQLETPTMAARCPVQHGEACA